MSLPKKICFAQPNYFILKVGGCSITWKTSNICPVIYPTPVDAQYFAVTFGIEYQLKVKYQFHIFILSLSPTSVRVQQWISDLSLTNPDRQVCMCVFIWVYPCAHLCNCVFVHGGFGWIFRLTKQICPVCMRVYLWIYVFMGYFSDWPSNSDQCAYLCICVIVCIFMRGWVTIHINQAGQTGV